MLGQVDSHFIQWFVCCNLLVVPFDLIICLLVNVAVLVATVEGSLYNNDSGAGHGSLATTKHAGIAHNRLTQM